MAPDMKKAAPVSSAKNTTETATTPTTHKQQEPNIMRTTNHTAPVIKTPTVGNLDAEAVMSSFWVEGDYDTTGTTYAGPLNKAGNVRLHYSHREGGYAEPTTGGTWWGRGEIVLNDDGTVDAYADLFNTAVERAYLQRLALTVNPQLRPAGRHRIVVARRVACEIPDGFEPLATMGPVRGTELYNQRYAHPELAGTPVFSGPEYKDGDRDSWATLTWDPENGVCLDGEAHTPGNTAPSFADVYGADDPIAHLTKMIHLYQGLLDAANAQREVTSRAA